MRTLWTIAGMTSFLALVLGWVLQAGGSSMDGLWIVLAIWYSIIALGLVTLMQVVEWVVDALDR